MTSAVSTFISRTVLRNHLQFLYSMLSSDVTSVAAAALHLLTAMVEASLFVAKHVYKAFNWKFKPLERLLETRKTAKSQKLAKLSQSSSIGDDVRAQFIRFAIAFLRSNDTSLIQDLLQVKNFIPEVLCWIRSRTNGSCEHRSSSASGRMRQRSLMSS